MDTVHRIKMWIGGLTEIGLMLLALAIVAALLRTSSEWSLNSAVTAW